MKAPTNRIVGDLAECDFRDQLAGAGLGVRIGPFNAFIRVRVPDIEASLYHLYRDYPVLRAGCISSMRVQLEERRSMMPPFRRKVRFSIDGRVPHEDMPAEHALAVLEWGLNLVIALRSHCFLMLHSAVLERNGSALLMPAAPGYGKTTLAAGLAQRGWRLFSDEFGLVRPDTTHMIPIPRPMALKNESLAIIRAFAPNAHMGPAIENTRKGTVAHLRPSSDSVSQQCISAPVSMIVFPRWIENSACSVQQITDAEGFMLLATNAFNYELLGELAFRTVSEMIKSAKCYRLEYSNLDDAILMLNDMADNGD